MTLIKRYDPIADSMSRSGFEAIISSSHFEGEFPKTIRANNIKLKFVSNNKNGMSFIKHKNTCVYQKVLVVKSIHNSKGSLKKCGNYR